MPSVDCADCIALHGAEMAIDGCRLARGAGEALRLAACVSIAAEDM